MYSDGLSSLEDVSQCTLWGCVPDILTSPLPQTLNLYALGCRDVNGRVLGLIDSNPSPPPYTQNILSIRE